MDEVLIPILTVFRVDQYYINKKNGYTQLTALTYSNYLKNLITLPQAEIIWRCTEYTLPQAEITWLNMKYTLPRAEVEM